MKLVIRYLFSHAIIYRCFISFRIIEIIREENHTFCLAGYYKVILYLNSLIINCSNLEDTGLD